MAPAHARHPTMKINFEGNIAMDGMLSNGKYPSVLEKALQPVFLFLLDDLLKDRSGFLQDCVSNFFLED